MRLASARAHYSPPKMPPGLVELIEGLTKEVLKYNPSDVYGFCAGHMQNLLEIRDGPSRKKSVTLEEKISKAQIKIRERAEKRRQEFHKAMHQESAANNVEEHSNDFAYEPVSEEPTARHIPPVHHEPNISQSSEIEISHMTCECNQEVEYTCLSDNTVKSELINTKDILVDEATNIENDVESIKESLYEKRSTPFTVSSNKTPEINSDSTNELNLEEETSETTEKSHVIHDTITKTYKKQLSNEDQQSNSTILKLHPVSNESIQSHRQNVHPTDLETVRVATTDELNTCTDSDPINNNEKQLTTKSEIKHTCTDSDTKNEQVIDEVDNNYSQKKCTDSDPKNNNEKQLMTKSENKKTCTDSDTINNNEQVIDEVDKNYSETKITDSDCKNNNENQLMMKLETKNMSTDSDTKINNELVINAVDNNNSEKNVYVEVLKLEMNEEVGSSYKNDKETKQVTSEVRDLSATTENVQKFIYIDENKDTILKNVKMEQVYSVDEVKNISGEIADIQQLNVPDNVCHLSENDNTMKTGEERSHIELGTCRDEDVKEGVLRESLGQVIVNKIPGEISVINTIAGTDSGRFKDDTHQSLDVDLKTSLVESNKNQVNEKNIDEFFLVPGDKEICLDNNFIQDDLNKCNVKSSSLKNDISEEGGCIIPTTELVDSTITSTEHKDMENEITNQIKEYAHYENHDSNMDLETAAVTIQKVFRTFLFKSRVSTFDDNSIDEDHFSDEENDKKEENYPNVSSLSKERRPHGITRMDTVLQTVNEEKSLSLSTDDSSTLSSAATIIQAHVRGFLVRNKLNSNKTLSTNSLAASNSHEHSLENDDDQQKNKTVLNIHIVPEGNFLSRDECLITSVELSFDGSPPSSINLHPLGYDKSERRKQLKREDAIQSISPPSNNSGKLSEDVDSVKESLSVDNATTDTQQVIEGNGITPNIVLDKIVSVSERAGFTYGSDSVETAVETTKDVFENAMHETITSLVGSSQSNDKSLSKLSSDEMDVVTPFASNEADSTEPQLIHSGEFHDAVLPTRVSRTDTAVVRGE